MDEKPMRIADGYATMKSTYDARGNLIRLTFYGVSGEPAQNKDGFYGREADTTRRISRLFGPISVRTENRCSLMAMRP